MKLSNQIFDLLEIFTAEVIATTFLLYFGCMGVIPSLDGTSIEGNSVQAALVWGFINTVCIVIFACISGCYMNPAITLCSVILKRISILVGLVYVVAECIGASLGIWLVKLTTSNDKYPESFCSMKRHPSVSISEAFLSEFMGTSVLIYAACSTWDPRNVQYQDSMPIKFGFVMATINFALGNYSACVNPARGFGPALINGFWDYQWFYWVAPLSASAFTTFFYKFTFLKKHQKFSNLKLTPGTQENISEFSGTAFLLYFGCLGLIEFKPPHHLPDLQAALVWGTTVSSVIMMFGHITRGHFNPAVTFCALVLRIISPLKCMAYFGAQMAGATVGYWLLTVTVPSPSIFPLAWQNRTDGFCNTVLRPGLSPLQGMLAEFLGTSMLIYAVCSAWDPRNSIWSDSVAIKFAFVIVTLVIGIGPLTGASLNPARSFAPALINGVWQDHWVYWVATFGASLVTTIIYRYIYLPEAHYVLQAKDKLSDQMRQGSLYSKGEDTGKLMPKKAPTPAPGPMRY